MDGPQLKTPEESERPRPGGLHDDLSFEELAAAYNFHRISTYARVMANLVLKQIAVCRDAPRVLDVGCGRGLGRRVDLQWEIKEAAGELWGLEPDETVEPAEGLFDSFQHALMETAELPEDGFDVIYSSMVMEHVADPSGFFRAVKHVLKPGGAYVFVTPNARSFVPRMTKLMHDLKLDEIVLRLIKSQRQIEQYHYPVQFKCNSVKLLDATAAELGFDPPDYCFIEGTGTIGYFPGPLLLVYKTLVLKRNLFKRPESLATLICRFTKPTPGRETPG